MNIQWRTLFGIFALFIASVESARADDVPFFSNYPTIDNARWYKSDGWSNGSYMACEWRADAITVKGNNLLLTLSDRGGKERLYGCPEIHTTALHSYGTYEARIRAAKGSGLNSAFFTYIAPGKDSPSHDEIDFEFLGKDSHTVQLNYYIYGKAQDETLIKLDYDASTEFHDYKFVWEPTKISWYIDGKLVHTSKEGAAMPSHPGSIYLSLWAGGKEENKWLGPFIYSAPATAEFEWVRYTPAR